MKLDKHLLFVDDLKRLGYFIFIGFEVPLVLFLYVFGTLHNVLVLLLQQPRQLLQL